MKYLFLSLTALALATPAVAGDENKQEPTSEEATDTSQNRMICKRQKSTGSRLRSEKVCMTAAQWAQLKRDERMETERGQAARGTNGGG